MHRCPECGAARKAKTDRQRIADLEREVAELRARPYLYPVYPYCTRPHYPQITWPYVWYGNNSTIQTTDTLLLTSAESSYVSG